MRNEWNMFSLYCVNNPHSNEAYNCIYTSHISSACIEE